MLKINFGSDGAQPTFLWHERFTSSYQGVILKPFFLATLLTNKSIQNSKNLSILLNTSQPFIIIFFWFTDLATLKPVLLSEGL